MKKKIIAKILIIVLLCTTTPVFASNNEAGNITSIGIGDYVQLGSYYGEPIVWRCVDIDENGPLMLSDKVISLKAFDAAGSNGGNDNSSSHTRDSGSSAHYRKQHGSNLWADSTLRTWLNSTETEGTVEYPCGNPPVANGVEGGFNAYDTEAGFLSSNNFTKNELNLIKEVKNVSVVNETDKDIATLGSERHIDSFDLDKCLSNYDTAYKLETTDRIFCLNIPQLLNAEKNIADIIYAHPTQTAVSRSEYKSDDLSDTKIWAYWLRDAMPANSVRTHVRNAGWEDKHVYFCWANDDIHLGVRPAFYLSARDFSSIEGSGTNDDPFICEGDNAEEPFDFNPLIFHANALTDNSNFAQRVKAKLNEEFLTELFIRELQAEGFDKSVALSESIDIIFKTADDIGSIKDFMCKPKDLYSAVILNMLETSVNVDTYDMCKEGSSTAKDIFSILKGVFKTKYGLDLSKDINLKELNKDQKDFVSDFIEEYFNNKHVLIGQADTLFEFLSNVSKAESTVESFLEEISSGVLLMNLNSSTKEIIHQMYEQCPASNAPLRQALDDCIKMVDKNVDQMNEMIAERTIKVAGEAALDYVVGKTWDNIKSDIMVACPELGIILLGYKCGTFVSNALFNTDKIKGKYLEMFAVKDVEHLADEALVNVEENFTQIKTEENAAALLSAVDLVYTLRDQDCVSAYNFVDEVDNALISRLMALWGSAPNQNAKEYIELRQEQYYLSHVFERTSWINMLPDEIYKKYSGYYEELAEKMINKRFVIKCPVDVFIYDENNDLVAKIVDDTPWVKQNKKIGIGIERSAKTISFFDKNTYQIEYRGNDTGKMDILINEFVNSQEIERSVYFYNIPVTDELCYLQTNSSALKTDDYFLEQKGEGKKVEPQMDSMKKAKPYIAKISSGVISKDGEYAYEMKGQYNELLSIKAFVPEDYVFVKWTSDAGNIFEDETAINTTFIMPNKDVAIKAQFTTNSGGNTPSGNIPAIENKIINAKNSVGGNISPVGKLQVKSGSKQTFTITPDPGYEIADVLVDGKSVGAVSSYTFENVTSDHTISATFKKKEDKDPEVDALAEKIKAAKDIKIKASSSQGVNKKGKRYIKVKWTKKGAAVTGYQVYRSFKKSGFKKFYTTKRRYYYNTKALRKGKRHYYKVRAYTVINGKRYYSKWSNLAYRTVKR